VRRDLCTKVVLAGFELTLFQVLDRCPVTRPPNPKYSRRRLRFFRHMDNGATGFHIDLDENNDVIKR